MGHRHHLLPSLLVFVGSACGAPDSNETANATEDGTGGSPVSASATDAGSDDGATDAGSTRADASSSNTGSSESSESSGFATDADGSSSSGAEAPAPDYATPHFPLQIGLRWSYRLTRTDGTTGADCLDNGDVHVMTVSEESGGVFTRTEEPACYFDSLEYRVDPPYVDVNSGAWYRQLLLPPEEGATWAAGGASGATYIWDEHHPSYSVEGGTFEDCWRRKQQGYDVWEIYCRDVGMVESYYDAWGSNTRSELVSFEG